MFSLKKLVESKGVMAVENLLIDLMREEKLSEEEKRSLTLKNLWESFVGECGDTLQYVRNVSGFVRTSHIQEADVRQSAFSNITGVLLANAVIEGYESVPRIGDKLVRIYPSNLKDERYPGFSASDTVETVGEGEEYPEAGLFDKYVTTGSALKKGKIISITEEAIYFDQTGALLDRARMLGERAALEREKTILKGVMGVENAYYPSGTATALYGAAPYLVTSNALSDWTNIEKAENDGLAAMTDEKGEAILVTANAILVPIALKATAKRILTATTVVHGDFDDANSVKTYSAMPIKADYEIVSSPLVHQLSGSSTSWWLGDFKRQFRWKEIWPIQTFRATQNDQDRFHRDVVEKYKVRYYGGIFAVDNKYVVKNTA